MQDKLFIDGKWLAPLLGGTLPVIDPATEEVFHHIPAATSADVDLAVKAARKAFDEGTWPRMTGAQRSAAGRRKAAISSPFLTSSRSPTTTG